MRVRWLSPVIVVCLYSIRRALCFGYLTATDSLSEHRSELAKQAAELSELHAQKREAEANHAKTQTEKEDMELQLSKWFRRLIARKTKLLKWFGGCGCPSWIIGARAHVDGQGGAPCEGR